MDLDVGLRCERTESPGFACSRYYTKELAKADAPALSIQLLPIVGLNLPHKREPVIYKTASRFAG